MIKHNLENQFDKDFSMKYKKSDWFFSVHSKTYISLCNLDSFYFILFFYYKENNF